MQISKLNETKENIVKFVILHKFFLANNTLYAYSDAIVFIKLKKI